MVNLFQITAIRHNQANFNPSSAYYMNPKFVKQTASAAFTDNDGVDQVGTLIIYNIARNNMPHEILAEEPPSTVLSRMNDGVTDGIAQVDLTVIAQDAPDQDYIPPTFLSTQGFGTQDIWLVQPHPLNNDHALLTVQNQVRTNTLNYHTFESASDIQTAVNA